MDLQSKLNGEQKKLQNKNGFILIQHLNSIT